MSASLSNFTMSDLNGISHMNSTSSSSLPATATLWLAASCSVLFAAVGCAGNLLTIVALPKCRRLRGATTALVASLAAADLLFCATCLPLTATRYIHAEWVLGDTLCALFPFFFYGNVAASLLSMTAITINRFVLIIWNRVYSRVYSKVNVAAMIFACWAFSYLLLVPTLAGKWGSFGYKPSSFSCTILKDAEGRSPRRFLFLFGFLLPTLTIVLCYSAIFYKVRSSARKLSSYEGGEKRGRRDEMRVTVTMLVCFCAFQLCFAPLMLVNVFEESVRSPLAHTLASILAWMSACANPFIYVLLNKNYRRAYMRLLCACRGTGTSPSGEAVSNDSRSTRLRLPAADDPPSKGSVSQDLAV